MNGTEELLADGPAVWPTLGSPELDTRSTGLGH